MLKIDPTQLSKMSGRGKTLKIKVKHPKLGPSTKTSAELQRELKAKQAELEAKRIEEIVKKKEDIAKNLGTL